MSQTRREFVTLSITLAAGVCACSCQSIPNNASSEPLRTGPIDIGPADLYAADGLYQQFRDQGFFLLRQNAQLVAIASQCTHRHCTINSQNDGSFACPCHGAAFDSLGHVTRGPAQRDLPRFTISRDAHGHLWVDPTQSPQPSKS